MNDINAAFSNYICSYTVKFAVKLVNEYELCFTINNIKWSQSSASELSLAVTVTV